MQHWRILNAFDTQSISEYSLRRLLEQRFVPYCGFERRMTGIQLWETIMVRHGLMLVGQTVSGKTEVENVRSSVMIQLDL